MPKYVISEDQKRRNYEARRLKAAAAALNQGREPGRVGRPQKLTPEEKEASRVAQNKKRSKRAGVRRSRLRAEKAIAEGREPGLVGKRSKRTSEEREDARKETWRRFRERKLAKRREYEAKWHRDKRAAIAAGTWVKPVIEPLTLERRREMGVRHAQLRRARILAAGGDGYDVGDYKAMLLRQKRACKLCLEPLVAGDIHVDHVTPLALGGPHDRSNLQLLCESCNTSKGARPPTEFVLEHAARCW